MIMFILIICLAHLIKESFMLAITITWHLSSWSFNFNLQVPIRTKLGSNVYWFCTKYVL